MANQTVAKLTAPTISLAGTTVSPGKDYTDGTWNVTAGIFESPNASDSSSKQFSVDNGRVERTLVFDDLADISMTVTGHTLRTRDTSPTTPGRPTFYGDLAGVLRNSDQTDRAEIRYTVNGKDPSRTKYYRWGIDDASTIRLQMNKTGGSETVIKARTYFRGRYSDATTVRVRIAKGTTAEAQTSHLNAGNTGRAIGDSSNS